jgi:CheY-like chemotaxis protein
MANTVRADGQRGERSAVGADVLAVEDSPGDRRLLREALDGLGREVVVVGDGRQAIDALGRALERGRPPGLVVVDLNLPGASGFDVLETVETDPRTDVPVVVLTNSRARRDRERAYEAGANAFLTKPADVDRFEELVAGAVGFWLPE